MTKRLKRIAPVQFGIVVGILYGLISLIFVPFFLLGILAASFAPAEDRADHPMLGPLLGLVFCVVIPFAYAVIGGLLGMLIAWLYNVIAGWVGGIEIEVE